MMKEIIADLQFDLNKPVYLNHPNDKFWQGTLHGLNVKYRVGKIKDGVQTKIEQVDKDYTSHNTAKNSLIVKIQQKLTKGYFSKQAKHQDPTKKINNNDKKILKRDQKNIRIFSGQYYQKQSQAIKLEVNNKKVKITRITDGKQKFQIRTMGTYQQAVQFCLKEEQWILSQGYKVNNKKFIYNFIDDDILVAQSQKSKRKPANNNSKQQNKKGNSNFLSVTQMTDDAISHRSRNISQTKSDRSYVDSRSSGDKFLPSKLGPPTSACIKVLLAQTWSDQNDPVGWIMSQKLDGVRCFWTGNVMYSRNGNRFFPPKFFTRNWPNSQLDGQLFIGRGRFSQTISAIKKNVPIDSQWEKVRYLVFDCPGLKKPFTTRLQYMEQVIKQIDNPYIKCHGHRVCNGFTDLFEQLQKVNKIQGQGLMLRDPGSAYQNRRSKTLLKVKTFYDDQATVLGYKEGTGRCYGMVGALKCRNSKGVQFEVGSGMTDDDRRHPPKIGSKITYKYQQFNKDSGKPRFPIYLRPYTHI